MSYDRTAKAKTIPPDPTRLQNVRTETPGPKRTYINVRHDMTKITKWRLTSAMRTRTIVSRLPTDTMSGPQIPSST